jgi:EAL and modified HD-GYP domain-containing signal transduction protein
MDACDAAAKEHFLARQPIVTAAGDLFGFELFFRTAGTGAAEQDDVEATAAVIANVLGELGIERALGQFLGFVNVTPLFLQTDLVEILDPQRIVLELPAATRITGPLVQRCAELARQGFAFAIEAGEGDLAAAAPLLRLARFVKIDSIRTAPERLAAVAGALKARSIRVVAEGVESAAALDRCRRAGCALFQGYHFAAPEMIAARRAVPAKAAMLRLLSLAYAGAPIGEIEAALKAQPSLGYNLLRLVNSAASGLRQPIGSLRQALLVVGHRQLQTWLQLLLYAGEHGKGDGHSPLLQTAAMRARLMELVARRARPGTTDLPDRAFMTGMLSLMDRLLGVTREGLLADLNVADDVRDALLRGAGVLADLLYLAQALERDDRPTIAALLARFPGLEVGRLLAEQLAAFMWANSLFREATLPMAARRG